MAGKPRRYPVVRDGSGRASSCLWWRWPTYTLLAWGFASGGLLCGLLGECHFFVGLSFMTNHAPSISSTEKDMKMVTIEIELTNYVCNKLGVIEGVFHRKSVHNYFSLLLFYPYCTPNSPLKLLVRSVCIQLLSIVRFTYIFISSLGGYVLTGHVSSRVRND